MTSIQKVLVVLTQRLGFASFLRTDMPDFIEEATPDLPDELQQSQAGVMLIRLSILLSVGPGHAKVLSSQE